jgi:hypothetical protein
LNPGETILASDLLGGIVELPGLSRPPILVVSDEAMYIILSGKDKAEQRIEFDDLVAVARRTDFTTRAIVLAVRDESGSPRSLSCVFHRRDHHGRTGDLITQRYFGRIVKDTTVEEPGGGPPNPVLTQTGVEYDLSKWSGEAIAHLLNALSRQRLPYQWDSSALLLTVASQNEGRVNRLVFPGGDPEWTPPQRPSDP